MRELRLKHGVTLQELADSVNVSMQYISEIELEPKRGKSLKLVQKAFETLIEKEFERLEDLKNDYSENKDRLFEISDTEVDL